MIRPLPDDPDREEVAAAFDMTSDEWLLAAADEYHTAAGEAMLRDGSNLQRVVLVEWPARVNRSGEHRTVRLMMTPEDALELAELLTHSATFLLRKAAS